MTKPTEFFIVYAPSPYNAILGLPDLNLMKAHVSTFSNKLSMMTNGVLHTIPRDIQQAQMCFLIELSKVEELKNIDQDARC